MFTWIFSGLLVGLGLACLVGCWLNSLACTKDNDEVEGLRNLGLTLLMGGVTIRLITCSIAHGGENLPAWCFNTIAGIVVLIWIFIYYFFMSFLFHSLGMRGTPMWKKVLILLSPIAAIAVYMGLVKLVMLMSA
ncbi:hypothetical protein JW868_04130 [Candidatus Woesearchaeota archaeon]|nr:hypothetical protein [Candidatus Woesearchaeota archaeon]